MSLPFGHMNYVVMKNCPFHEVETAFSHLVKYENISQNCNLFMK